MEFGTDMDDAQRVNPVWWSSFPLKVFIFLVKYLNIYNMD